MISAVPPSPACVGFTLQVAYAGAPAQKNDTVPGTPATDVSSSGYAASPPAAMLWVVLPLALRAKSTPVPVNCTLCGDDPALSVKVTLPVRDPGAVGVNAISTVHAPPAAKLPPQVLLPATGAKSPVTAMLWISSGIPPLLVSVTVCAAAVSPTPVAANVIADTGDSDTPAGATPIPLNATVWLRYSSVTVSTPAPGPTLFGTKATSSEQLACPFSEFPHPFTTVKSPLATCPEISVSAASPALVSVTCWVVVAVFSSCAAKLKVSGASASVAGSKPTPLSDAVCVPALSAMLKLPVRVPPAVGWNATDTVQPDEAPSVAPQVFAVIAKSPVTAGVCRLAVTPPVLDTVIFWAALDDPTLVPA